MNAPDDAPQPADKPPADKPPADKPPADKPWYRDGLRFECTQCGDCCTGAPGYVWVNADEIRSLAEAHDLSVGDFERRYVRKVGQRKSLIERSNGDCIFFDGQTRKCRVYAVRPLQCRTWPFWDSNLRSPATWQETCRACPGSGVGKLYSLEQVESQRRIKKV